MKPVRFCIVVAGSNIIYWSFLVLLTEKAGIPYLISACIGGFFSFLWNYLMHSFWTFGDKSIL